MAFLPNVSIIGQSSAQDTIALSDSTTQKTKRNAFKEIFHGKPGRAAFYSLILPGGGQIYNKKWLKLPITYAIEGGAAAWLIYNTSEYRKYNKIFKDLVKGVDNNPNDPFNMPSDVKPKRDKFRKQSEYAWVFMILAHLYNVFDAYVDRHMMDFDISEDLSIRPIQIPTPYPSTQIGLVYHF